MISHTTNMNDIIKPNESTMENKIVVEAKNTPENVKFILEYYFSSSYKTDGYGNAWNKLDSLVTVTVELTTYDVNKTKDSIKNQNKQRLIQQRLWR